MGPRTNSSTRRGWAKGNRCCPRWTRRFPDPEGRESATPFRYWLCVHSCQRQWRRPPRVTARGSWIPVRASDLKSPKAPLQGICVPCTFPVLIRCRKPFSRAMYSVEWTYLPRAPFESVIFPLFIPVSREFWQRKSSREPASPSWGDSNSAASSGRQDFLSPRGGKQRFSSRAGAQL